MNLKIVLVILWIKYLIISKWYISHNHIKEVVLKISIFKPPNTDIGSLVKLLCYSTWYIIKLYTIKIALTYGRREITKKVSYTTAWLKDISTLKAKAY